jgi:hypothetical protein
MHFAFKKKVSLLLGRNKRQHLNICLMRCYGYREIGFRIGKGADIDVAPG